LASEGFVPTHHWGFCPWIPTGALPPTPIIGSPCVCIISTPWEEGKDPSKPLLSTGVTADGPTG